MKNHAEFLFDYLLHIIFATYWLGISQDNYALKIDWNSAELNV